MLVHDIRNSAMPITVVALDAMGVIYQAQDDVAELLVPFILGINPKITAASVEKTYLEASLGNLSAEEFWASLGIDSSVEEDFLSRHSLNPGLRAFVESARKSGLELWCLSNDISRWSLRLRETFDLDEHFSGFVISGDIGIRKPDEGAYLDLIDRTGEAPENILFVDDRSENVVAARAVGLRSVVFDARNRSRGSVSGFAELSDMVADVAAGSH